MNYSIVVMGVAGCGKSSLARALSLAHGLILIEGDDFHSPASQEKMRQGQALTDQDRAGWFQVLCDKLRAHAGHVVLSCSALKKEYRDVLRAAVPGLRFVYLELGIDDAKKRVAGRGADHYFPPTLVDSQFQALEPPWREALVLRLDATQQPEALKQQVADWLQYSEASH
jgi:gluconokinase